MKKSKKFDIINNIPNELVSYIFSHLSYEELESCKYTSKYWNYLIKKCCSHICDSTSFPRACGHCHYFQISNMNQSDITDEFITVYFNSIDKKLVVGDIIDFGYNIGKYLYVNGENFIHTTKPMAFNMDAFGITHKNKFQKILPMHPIFITDDRPFPQCYWKDYFNSDTNISSLKSIGTRKIMLPKGKRCLTFEKTEIHYGGYNNIFITIKNELIIKKCKKHTGYLDIDNVRYFTTYFDWGGYKFTLVFDACYSTRDDLSNMKEKLFLEGELKLYYTPTQTDKELFGDNIIFIKRELSTSEEMMSRIITAKNTNYANNIAPLIGSGINYIYSTGRLRKGRI